jgi:hypothetical protein
MTVDAALKEYKTLGGKVFGKARYFYSRAGFFFWERSKYSTEAFQKIVSEVVKANKDKEFISPDGSGSWKTFRQPHSEDGEYRSCKT